jgi:hypothetical protein
MTLEKIDSKNTQLASLVVAAYADATWDVLHYAARWTPKGDVGATDFFVVSGSSHRKQYPSDREAERRLSDATKEHLQLLESIGQPRWYMMIVRVERSGKYTVNFDYREYVEHDISRYNVEVVDGKPTLVRNPHFRDEFAS